MTWHNGTTETHVDLDCKNALIEYILSIHSTNFGISSRKYPSALFIVYEWNEKFSTDKSLCDENSDKYYICEYNDIKTELESQVGFIR